MSGAVPAAGGGGGVRGAGQGVAADISHSAAPEVGDSLQRQISATVGPGIPHEAGATAPHLMGSGLLQDEPIRSDNSLRGVRHELERMRNDAIT